MNLNDLAATVLQQQRSTPDLIADALRQAILHGLFTEGQSLRQDEIATRFGVSRIPVREALRQLEAEGLVIFHPNRGAMVTTLSPAEAQEIYEIRIALETTALRLAIPQLVEPDIQKADVLLAALDQTVDIGRWAELDFQFHRSLYIPANRPRLLSLITTHQINSDRYLRLFIAHADDLMPSQKQHHQLLDYCRQKDIDAAIALLHQHLSHTQSQLVTFLQHL